jgi:capsular exopolysaccharide synthesis family protein
MPQDAGLPDPSLPLPIPHSRDKRPIAGRIEAPTAARATPPPALTGPTALAASPDVFSLLVALRHRWVSAVVLGGTLAALAAVSVWFLLAPRNTSFATLRVLYLDPEIMKGTQTGIIDFNTTLQTTAHEVISTRVIAEALKRDEVKNLHLELTEVNPVQAILDDLKAEFKPNSELLTILFMHADPKVATTVANAIKNAYLATIVADKLQDRKNKYTVIKKAYGEVQESIKLKKAGLKNATKDLETDPALAADKRIELKQNLRDTKLQKSTIGLKIVEMRAQLEVYDAKVKAMTGSKKDGEAVDPKSSPETTLELLLDSDQETRKLQERLSGIDEDIAALLARNYRENSDQVTDYRTRRKSVEKQLANRKKVLAKRLETNPNALAGPGMAFREDPAIIRAHFQKQVERLEQLDADLEDEIVAMSEEMAKTPPLLAEYEQQAEEIKNAELNAKVLSTQLEREQLELQAASRITSYQDAELMKKDPKKQVLATAVAPFAVMFAVCFGLAFMEFRKRRVRSAGEISRGLGIRVVGAVPNVANLQRQLVRLDGENELEGTPVMESIDAIRTRLLHESNTRSTRIVMVTSAGHGEGKTTLAAALATSLARAGRKTLLLDGDLRRPTVHELFEIPMQPGLSEVLLAEVEVSEAALEQPQDNLSVLPAGQWDREVLLALSRDGLEGIFERLGEEFDFILIDSHPVLAATDSLLIGRHVDAVILSVLREVSQMPRVYAAQQQLTGLGIRVMGAVVSGIDQEEVFSAPATAGVA